LPTQKQVLVGKKGSDSMAKVTTRGAPNTQVDGYQQAKTETDWVGIVEARIQESTNWVERRQMMVNLNYYVGNQWITWDRNSNMVVAAPNEGNQERIAYNKVRSKILAKIAKQTKNRIKYDVVPDTNTDERIDTAKAATKYLHVWWDEQEMDRKTRDIFLNNNVKGWCVLKIYFDPERGHDITPDEEEEKVYTGQIVATIEDPLTIYIDPSSTNDEEVRWWVSEKPRDLDYIFEKYGVEVSADPNINYYSNYDVTSVNNTNGTTTGTLKKNKNMAMVRELWINPCPKYPNGFKVTTTMNTYLDSDNNAGRAPYFIFGDMPIPGSVKYQAALQDAIPVQRELNIAKTMEATHMKRMGNSIWTIGMGSDVDEEMLTNEESQILYYNTEVGRPERVAPNDLPSFYDRIIQQDLADLEDMFGTREITQQSLPSGLDTASGLHLMVEQENEKLTVTMFNYEQGMKKALKRVLQLMQKHYTEERQGKILGPDNEIEVISFTGSDLTGEEDITIVQGSSLPEMKSAQEDRIMTLWKMNAIVGSNGMPDANLFLKLMGMGSSSAIFEQHLLDENKSKMENRYFEGMQDGDNADEAKAYSQQLQQFTQQMMMLQQQQQQQQGMQGQPPMQLPPPTPPSDMPEVRDFQDHNIHIYQHNTFRKSSAYDKLSKDLQKVVDDHIAQHQKFIDDAASKLAPPPEIQKAQMQQQTEQQKLQVQAQQNQATNQLKAMEIQSKTQQHAQQLNADSQHHVTQLLHEDQLHDKIARNDMGKTVIQSLLKGGEKKKNIGD